MSVDISLETYIPQNNCQAPLSLSFVIVGASIAGLSCAISLRKAGHIVRVLEKRGASDQSPGGVKIPPNMSKVWARWGLQEELGRISGGSIPLGVIKLADTAELISEIIYHKEVMDELEGHIYHAHQTDVLKTLHRLATELGAQVDFGCEVIDVKPDIPSVRIKRTRLESGSPVLAAEEFEEVRGDILIGADGAQSTVKSFVRNGSGRISSDSSLGEYWRTRKEPTIAYVFTIPRAEFENDEELAKMAEIPNWNLWLGNSYAVLAHSACEKKAIAVVIYVNYNNLPEEMAKAPRPKISEENSWEERPASEVFPLGIVLEPVIERLTKLAKGVAVVRQAPINPTDDWHDDAGKMLLVGDAIHYVFPHATQAAALSTEDGAVLGRLFSVLKSRDQIPALLRAFEDLRQVRCKEIQFRELELLDLISMPYGEACDARNESMRSAKGDWDELLEDKGKSVDGTVNGENENNTENLLAKQWEEFKYGWGYNAFDDADSWLVDWGFLLDPGRKNAKNAVEEQCSISV